MADAIPFTRRGFLSFFSIGSLSFLTERAEQLKKLITNHNMKYQNYLPASRKEVFQPHLPVRLPCYDLAPVTDFTLKRERPRSLGTADSHGLTGGVYKARERIHRAMADARLLANPASWSRVADSDPN